MRGHVEHSGRRRNYDARDYGDGRAGDGVGGDKWDTKLHSDGEQRQRGEGCDVGGVMRDSGGVRRGVADKQRIGNGCDVYGACDGAESGDGDADGDVGERWDEVGVGNDHGDGGGAAANGSQCDDHANGHGIGVESGASAERDSDERRKRSGRDLVGDFGNFQRESSDDGDICCTELGGRRDHDNRNEQG